MKNNESMGNDNDKKKKLDQRRKKVKSYGLGKSYRTWTKNFSKVSFFQFEKTADISWRHQWLLVYARNDVWGVRNELRNREVLRHVTMAAKCLDSLGKTSIDTTTSSPGLFPQKMGGAVKGPGVGWSLVQPKYSCEANLYQPRPQGFSLKKWVGHPLFEGKALGTRL